MIFWIDTETSGLDPRFDQLLEFVCVVTDDQLSVVETFGPWAIEPSPLARPIQDWDDIVIKMHTQNGLLSTINEGSVITPEELDDNCFDWLQLCYKEFESVAPMAGSTIGFDRGFMKRWMPRTERFFHYRSIDISTIKELAKVWNKLVYDLRPIVADDQKEHRALPDILGSIDEARYYFEHFFKVAS